MPQSAPTIDDIRRAAASIAGAVLRTPCPRAASLSARLGADIFLKLESLQRTGSFKERGALNRLLALTAELRARGVITMSAGNHAQGVAYHARRLGIPATIVMPEDTPFTKIERTEAYGARVMLRGANLTEARQAADALAEAAGLAFVHPYDDPAIIAGQGTIGLEMLEEHPDLDVMLVPLGGGGLISGIAIAARALKPEIEIIGVQTEAVPAMHHLLRGEALRPAAQTLAEGIAVREPGHITETIVRALVADIVLVSEIEIERAIEALLLQQNLVSEGAGAAGLAALLKDPARYAGRKVGIVLSGGNIDARLLANVLMRGMVHGGKLVRLRIEISDTPGTLARVAGIVGSAGGNIVEVAHQRLFDDVPVKLADLDLVIETRGPAHIAQLEAALAEAGYRTRMLSHMEG